ncbi:MAG: GNAT family N-acetyltransferase [Roseivirga sp.]|nr:GNAT family N-acetyltransferase [Roseivirga sp.]
MNSSKMQDISVRHLEAQDYEAFAALRRLGLTTDPTSFWSTVEEEAPVLKEKYESRISKGNNFTLGAFAGDQLVGIMAFTPYVLSKLAHKGDIHGVYVHPDFRGRKVAHSLLTETLKGAFSIEGIVLVGLSVTAINTAARALYEKHGFVTCGLEIEGMQVDGVLYDQYWMQLPKAKYHESL